MESYVYKKVVCSIIAKVPGLAVVVYGLSTHDMELIVGGAALTYVVSNMMDTQHYATPFGKLETTTPENQSTLDDRVG